ncbi:unnamed protein product [Hermetia illucens]|uniref:Uncharacterized protein n=1 Tax=Hermetia illucens TaxID=343691 RepID=A0A7R8YXA9_HERIL|nr:unnamed protein product [Hermetia illucens]
MPHDAIQTCILPVDRILLRCREQFLSCADATALKQVALHATRRFAASADESQATTRSGQSMLNREACGIARDGWIRGLSLLAADIWRSYLLNSQEPGCNGTTTAASYLAATLSHTS